MEKLDKNVTEAAKMFTQEAKFSLAIYPCKLINCHFTRIKNKNSQIFFNIFHGGMDCVILSGSIIILYASIGLQIPAVLGFKQQEWVLADRAANLTLFKSICQI